MEVKTWEQLAIWLCMQFPVLAAAFFVARWFLNRAEVENDKHSAQLKERYADLLREKDGRLADRDGQIAKLETEIVELRAKLSRSKKKDDGGEANT